MKHRLWQMVRECNDNYFDENDLQIAQIELELLDDESAIYFMIAHELAMYLRRGNVPFTCGKAYSCELAYLLYISSFNPRDLFGMYYSDFIGVDGKYPFELSIKLPAQCLDDASKRLDELYDKYSNELSQFNSCRKSQRSRICLYQDDDMTRLFELQRLTGKGVYDVSFFDVELLHRLKDIPAEENIGFTRDITPSLKHDYRLETFEDYVYIAGAALSSFTDNCLPRTIDKDEKSPSNLIVFRDTVYLMLLDAGINTDDAYRLADYTRKGRWQVHPHPRFRDIIADEGVANMLENIGRKSIYLCSMSMATESVITTMWLEYFWINYNELMPIANQIKEKRE